MGNEPDRNSPGNGPLLEVRDLVKEFPLNRGFLSRYRKSIRAVDGVSLTVRRGETVGLVGESGSGKTTTGRCILRLIEPTSGEVIFRGENILKLGARSMRETRREIQIIFQDPYGSLNPRMTVGTIVGEPLAIHKTVPRRERRDRVAELLKRVGLDPDMMRRYPHEFSGGQRQRIGVARAIALNPSLIVADEPVSALDVSVQAQVVNLLQDLQEEYGIAYLFIAHDLSVVEHISDRVAVMYRGKIVEEAGRDQLYSDPKHPYTQALLSSVPIPDPAADRHPVLIPEENPGAVGPAKGCSFHPRCPAVMEICRERVPRLLPVGEGQKAACFLYEKGSDPAS
ncbi:MAG: ABC transporter ATP-binding protein [Acidobacteria bacterium]|nr:ABC transporter ATP-binding protein [Acidobacteriota bacterium]